MLCICGKFREIRLFDSIKNHLSNIASPLIKKKKKKFESKDPTDKTLETSVQKHWRDKGILIRLYIISIRRSKVQ